MIREININDKELYINLAKEFYSSDAVLSPLPDEFHERAFCEAVNSKIYLRIFIFEYDGKTAGYSTVSKKFETEAGGFTMWIEDFYVREEFRGKGIGKEFLDYMDNNFPYARRLRLEVEEENEGAVRLYKSRGFEALPYMQMIKNKEQNN
ncbi:MAG: GNAT family N-acetyltransferase [Clostridia bacterium]|nr:GNAT family N-acetyltransferase [Clostridia bacterium]